MAVSKSQQKAVHKYVKANYDRMELTVPKGRKDIIKAHATAQGESVNGFINRAIDQTMALDGARGPTGTPQGCEGISNMPDAQNAPERPQKAATGED